MTKNQFYVLWTIVGLVAYYGIHQTLKVLVEIIISLEIKLNLAPNILLYSQTGWYSIIISLIIILVLRIIKTDSIPLTEFNPKKIRIWLVGLSIIGFVFQLVTNFIRAHRLDILIPYLDKHNINASEYYSNFISLPGIPNFVLFTSAIVIFFYLTKKNISIDIK
jgi:hypothetical protein